VLQVKTIATGPCAEETETETEAAEQPGGYSEGGALPLHGARKYIVKQRLCGGYSIKTNGKLAYNN
jgi:hypothetical protein